MQAAKLLGKQGCWRLLWNLWGYKSIPQNAFWYIISTQCVYSQKNMIEMFPLKVLGCYFFSSFLVWKNRLENIPSVTGMKETLNWLWTIEFGV